MYLERLFLELIFICSLIFLVFFYYKLFWEVTKLRRSKKISRGNRKNQQLERAIRAHSNFIEYVPLSLILSLVLYFHNYLIFSCFSILFLTAGRIYHKKGMFNEKEKEENFRLRRLGMKLTIYSFYISIFGLIFYLGQAIYFFVQSRI